MLKVTRPVKQGLTVLLISCVWNIDPDGLLEANVESDGDPENPPMYGVNLVALSPLASVRNSIPWQGHKRSHMLMQGARGKGGRRAKNMESPAAERCPLGLGLSASMDICRSFQIHSLTCPAIGRRSHIEPA